MLKLASLLLGTAAMFLAAPTAAASEYTLSVYAPGDHFFDHLKVEAGGQSFYLAVGYPGTYCPIAPASCPPGNETVFFNQGSMSVEVPGGQQNFIAPNGLWSYTQAHSISMPTGSYLGDWTFHAGNVHPYACCPKYNKLYNCAPGTGYYSYKSPDETVGGLFACPPPSYAAYGTWIVYGKTPGFTRTDCKPIAGLRSHVWNGPQIEAWQYV